MTSLLKIHSIVYVEDEPQIRANITEYLESYFHKVYVASDGEEGFLLYKKYHPDVILLDINLPKLSGIEIARKIRESDNDIKIVMLTAHTDEDILISATELNLTKYLVKPISTKDFKDTMEYLSQTLAKHSRQLISLSNGYIWDKENKILYQEEEKIPLSNKEHALLQLLISNKGKKITYADIMAYVWEDSYDKEISIASVKNLISHLRKKLPKESIDTLYGEGYMLR